MNRKIEFRGKCSHCDAWAYGNLVDYDDGEAPEIHGFDPYREGDEVWREITVDPDTVGQYIGRTDCDGTPIYEGDIITVNGKYPKVVKYIDEWCAFCVANIDDLKDPCMSTWDDACIYKLPTPDWWCNTNRKIKVIGNIYDNQDLLNKK